MLITGDEAVEARAAAEGTPPRAPSLCCTPGTRELNPTFTWSWSASDGVVGSECSLDGAPFAACTSPYRIDALTDGAHRFEVRVLDDEGLYSPSAVRTWTADVSTPYADIARLPRYWIASRDVSLSFTADRAGATFECLVDRGAWAPCTSPLRLTGLSEGEHELQVRATNNGRTGPADTEGFGVDVTAPDTRIRSSMLVDGMLTSLPFARFVIEHRMLGTDEGHAWINDSAWVRCVLDGGPVVLCRRTRGSSASTGWPTGTHVFQAFALDEAGNADPTPAVFTWVVGAPEVDTTITSGPPAASGSRGASFTLASDGEDGFQCRLDDGA